MRPEIVTPETPADVAAFRALNWEYRDFLLSLPAPHNAAVLATYPEDAYAAILDAAELQSRPPHGRLRLMRSGDEALGCGTVQTIGPGDAEIKRVYIRPGAQGAGLGRRLMTQLIADCRDMGFSRILMDTGKILTRAAALYDSMGFVRRGPYADLPEASLKLRIFYEMPLD